MIEYDKLNKIAKEKLSEYRYNHTRNVEKRALEYAKIYNIDENTVKLTALAHDIAKELSHDETLEYIKKYNIKLDKIEKVNSSLIHAKIGSYIAKYEYGFTDDMANAVRYHTTGKEKMSMLEKIIYLADATEETREIGCKYANIVKEDIDKDMVEVSKFSISKVLENSKLVHLDSIKCYNYYLGKVYK